MLAKYKLRTSEKITLTVTILYITDPQSDSGHIPAILKITQFPGWTVFSQPALGMILFSYIISTVELHSLILIYTLV